MGGILKVDSEVDHGSEFWFELLLPLVEDLCATPKEPMGLPEGYQGKERTILVVDDIVNNSELLNQLFQSMRFKVQLAQSGDEAFALLKKSQPDLIFMDLKMPIMDGFQALTILREMPACAHIPVVAISASVTEKEHALSAGFDAFIPKPTPIKAFVDVAGDLLNLEWIVATDEENEEEVLTYPPAVELEQLREWIQLGKMRQIIKWAEVLATETPEYTGFAQRVITHAKKVDEEKLQELISGSR